MKKIKKLYVIWAIVILISASMPVTSAAESEGFHEIKVIAYDTLGNTASDQINVNVKSVYTEPWIDGPLEGVVGEEYTYCIRGTGDIEAVELYGMFVWGDGGNTG